MILYKYMSWPLDGENHARELIESDEIYLSRPTEFNDPYDIGIMGKRNKWLKNTYATQEMYSTVMVGTTEQ